MHRGDAVPRVDTNAPMGEVIRIMSDKKLGMTCVVGADGRLAGIITDGDLRRILGRGNDLLALRAQDAMVADPVTIDRDELAARALRSTKIDAVPSAVCYEILINGTV